MKFSTRRIAAAGAAWVFAAIAGCGEAEKPKELPIPEVTAARSIARDIAEHLEFTGTTEAIEEVDLRARVTGYLREIKFKDGDEVKAGDVLFVIEKRPFQIAVDSAKAHIKNAEAKKAKSQADREKALAQQQTAAANLQLREANYRRIADLVQRRAASQQEVDVQEAELAAARASVANAAAEVVAAEAAIATAHAEIEVAQAELKLAEQSLSYTEVEAPIDGRIGRHLVDVGNLVTTGETSLAILENIEQIHAYFYISDTDFMRTTALGGSNFSNPTANDSPKLTLRFENDPAQREYPGEMDFRQLSVDEGTGTVLCRGKFKNPDRTLAPGLFVRIRHALPPESKVMVESRALSADQRGDFLMVVNPENDNKVEHRIVRLGIERDGMRVIESGLKAGELVIVDGLQRARHDQPVAFAFPEDNSAAPQPPAENPGAERAAE